MPCNWRNHRGRGRQAAISRLAGKLSPANCNDFLAQAALTLPSRATYNHATQLHLEPTGVVISRTSHRRTAWAVAVCYVLASTLSGMWHTHAGGQWHAGQRHVSAAAESAAGHSSHHHHARHEHEVCQGGEHESCPAGDDDCVICRFVAQSALSTLPVAEPAKSVVVAEVRPLAPPAPVIAILSCGLARAPPPAS